MTNSEQRSDPRYTCLGQVAIDRAPGLKPFPGRLIDLSLGGCRIASGMPGEFRLNSEIEFVIERGVTVFRVRGAVRSADAYTGEIGIEFTAITMRGRIDLKEMIEELKQCDAQDRNQEPRSRSSLCNAA
jgi:hypothetical protein